MKPPPPYSFTADDVLKFQKWDAEYEQFWKALVDRDFCCASLDGINWTTSYNDGAIVHFDGRGGSLAEVMQRFIDQFVTRQ